ncbi:MAG: LPS-assembly protein LptD [Aquificae bacterium]|nr:LPS-assembly protein LptD [Aquificota bacterium]
MALFLIFLLFAFSFSLEIFSKVLRVEGSKVFAEGDVEVFYGDYYIRANRAVLERETEELFAEGDVYIRHARSGLEVRGSSAYVDMRNDRGYFLNAEGKFREFNFRARRIERLAKERFLVFDALLTTCPLEDAELAVCTARADVRRERALAFHNKLLFFGVPVFYLPFYPVPLGGRKSGFLMPTLGSTTYSSFVYIQPFFWAMDEDKDATFFFDYRREQLKGLGAEYRQAFSEDESLVGSLSLYRENKRRGSWWEGRGIYRRHRYKLFGEFVLGNWRFVLEELSDPYFYEDISFKSSEVVKPYSASFLSYEREGKDFLFYFKATHYRDLTSESNNAVQLLPELGLYLKPRDVFGLSAQADISFTNFYTNDGGSSPRFIFNPSFGKYYEFLGLRNYTSVRFINQLYEGKGVNTFLFSHSFPQYFTVRYAGGVLNNFLELAYNFSPRDYEVGVFDFQDELTKKNNLSLKWLGGLFRGRTLMDFYIDAGYNFLASYAFPTDGRLINKRLLPVRYFVGLYPFDFLKLWQDGIYDFNLGIWARSISGITAEGGNFYFSFYNAVYKDSYNKKTSDQVIADIRHERGRLFWGLSLNYDRLSKRELSRGAFVGLKGSCWGLSLSYSRRYYANRGDYVNRLSLKFNLFFIEELEFPLVR